MGNPRPTILLSGFGKILDFAQSAYVASVLPVPTFMMIVASIVVYGHGPISVDNKKERGPEN